MLIHFRRAFARVLLTGMLALFLFCCPAGAAGSPHILFLSPTVNDDHPFWRNYILFMEAAADDLGVDLDVVGVRDRYDMVDAARHILSGPGRPDYLVLVYLKGTGSTLMELAAQTGVPVFLVNTVVQPEDLNVIGFPRKKYPNWLGDMCYCDEDGGHDLAEALFAAAKGREGCPPHLLALTGSRDNSASRERIGGLEKALALHRKAILKRELSARWKKEVAYEKTAAMLDLDDGVNMVWAASDAMALGAARAFEERGRVLGKDAFVGGFDWSVEGLDAIEAGRMTASAGGHFMEGAWALVLLHDYHHGKDFAPLGLEFRFPMQLLDGANVAVGRRLLVPERWRDIDFKRFSRVYSGRADYDFSLGKVLDALGKDGTLAARLAP